MTQPKTSPANKWLAPVLAITIAAAALLVFAPARNNDFLNWDDQSYVTQNDHVQGGLTVAGLAWAFTQSHSANWHPLTWMSHMLDVELSGLRPSGHHTTNLLLHAANAALLFLLLHRLTRSVWRSALVAAIFALHPLRVESVAWVAERKDVLSTFFGLLCLMAYGNYVSGIRYQVPGKHRFSARSWYVATFLLLALGLMSKPMLVTWPFVMLLLDFWPLKRIEPSTFNIQLPALKRLTVEKLPFFALVAVSSVVTLLAQKHGGAVASFEHLPLPLRLENAAVAYLEYLGKFFWPVNLSPIYPHPPNVPGWQWIGAAALLAGLTAATWRRRQRFPFALTGWLWFLGTLVPVIGLVQVGSQALADRYTYIPMIGLAIALVWLGDEITTRMRLPKAVILLASLVLVALLSWRTTTQLTYWKNTETLFRYTLTLSPSNAQALFGLGCYLADHGQTLEGRQLLEQAIRLQPTFVEAIGTLASTLDGEGHYTEAVRYYEEALKVQPNHAGVLNNFAWLRASCPNEAVRNGAQAVQLATKACDLTGYNKPLFIGTLAAAQAEAGDFQSAIATAERAAALASSLGLVDTTARNRELIEFYRQGKAAHGSPAKAQ